MSITKDEGGEVIVWPLSNPQLTIEGVVREVSPVADATTRTFTVKVTLQHPPPSIRFGMSIGGRWKSDPALLVTLPLSTLFEKKGTPAVWVFDPQSGSATLKPVTVARYEAETVVRIASGLAKGEIVISAGVNTLREGRRSGLTRPTRTSSGPLVAGNFQLMSCAAGTTQHRMLVEVATVRG